MSVHVRHLLLVGKALAYSGEDGSVCSHGVSLFDVHFAAIDDIEPFLQMFATATGKVVDARRGEGERGDGREAGDISEVEQEVVNSR